MEKEMVTIKTTKAARDMLRVLAAKMGVKQYEVLESLLSAELKKP